MAAFRDSELLDADGSDRRGERPGEVSVSEHLDRARDYHQAIRRILLRDWDPIGVADLPQAQDEYDSYIAEVYGLLIRREPRHKLVDFLWWAETEHMALCGNRSRTEQVADRLLNIGADVD